MTIHSLGKVIEVELYQVKKLLQGRLRAEERAKFNKFTGKMHAQLELGKPKLAITAMMQTWRQQAHMDEITLADGTTTADASDIMKGLTDHFEEWYRQQPEDVHRGVHNLATWEDGYRSWDVFREAQRDTQVPEHLLRKVWEAMTVVPGVGELTTDMERCLNINPTYTQFCQTISHLPKGKAAGPDQITYDMIKAWPDVFKQAAFTALDSLWTNKEIPEHWKWMWLVAIPKKAGGTRPADMRPLALINTIRKVWVSIILRKITSTWEQHNILSAGAHGGRPGRGTTSATLPFINMCEHSIQTGRPRYIQSFDMKKAFDTLSPAVKMMGWRRLGVPGHIAQYLVNMDIGGGYMVRMPETERLWAEFNGDIARMQTIPGATFQHQLGSPQGDVVSPAIWIAVFDILVRALETDAVAVQAEYDSFRADEAADQASKGISTLD